VSSRSTSAARTVGVIPRSPRPFNSERDEYIRVVGRKVLLMASVQGEAQPKRRSHESVRQEFGCGRQSSAAQSRVGRARSMLPSDEASAKLAICVACIMRAASRASQGARGPSMSDSLEDALPDERRRVVDPASVRAHQFSPCGPGSKTAAKFSPRRTSRRTWPNEIVHTQN
jgi:hypothetical protein